MKMTTIIVLSDPTHQVPNKKVTREREREPKEIKQNLCCNTLKI